LRTKFYNAKKGVDSGVHPVRTGENKPHCLYPLGGM